MANKISILCNTLEQMAADAEDIGAVTVQPLLTLEDMRVITHALILADRATACEKNACCENTESKKPLPLMQREFLATIDGMTSPDYKERFKAEYWQTKIRYERLKAFNTKIAAAQLTSDKGALGVDMPTHDCPDYLLREQQKHMGEYLQILEIRAVIEGISLY